MNSLTKKQAFKLGVKKATGLGMLAIIVVLVAEVIFYGLILMSLLNRGSGCSGTLTATGFAKIKPQLAATGFSRTGQPSIIFTNGVGTTVNMKGGKIIDDGAADVSCTLTPDMFVPKEVPAGANTRLSGAPTDCIRNGSPGDVYNARVTFTYEVTIGGETTTHTESGTIRGPYE